MSKRTGPRESAPPAAGQAAAAHGDGAPALNLTDFIDARTLQELQDGFAALTHLSTIILDADGKQITQPTDTERLAQSSRMLTELVIGEARSEVREGQHALFAPINVDGHELGSIAIDNAAIGDDQTVTRRSLEALAIRLGVQPAQMKPLIDAVDQSLGANRGAAIQFMYLLANHIARLCYQQYELNQRVQELRALYNLSTELAGQRDLQHLLDTAARSAAQVMKVKAASIRLITPSGTELKNYAVHNLSKEYLNKGPVLIESNELNQRSLKGEVVYVEDMSTDPRVQYPEDAKREGLVSILTAGIVFKDQPIGVIRLYTGETRHFTHSERQLLQAIAQLVATAIQNARLDGIRQESQRVQRQIQLAANVQNRMMPSIMPQVPPFDVDARYVPSFELGGDFFDFIDLEGNLGVVVGDVVGKGVAASLLMASVRASLRAYAQDVYDIDEIIARVNIAMSRDTLPNEFATMFYGVLDPQTLRLTYCNAGHDPPLLLRDGQFTRLDVGGMVIGIDDEQVYYKGLIDLKPEDRLLFYTDGLTDALNFSQEKFGRDRVMKAMTESAGIHSAHFMLNHILWEMRRFVGMNRNTDDTTLVVIKVNKPD